MTLKEQVLSELEKRIEIAPDVYDYEIVENDWIKYGKTELISRLWKPEKTAATME